MSKAARQFTLSPIEPTSEKTVSASSPIPLLHENSGRLLYVFDGMILGRTEGHENFQDDSLMSRKHCIFSILKGTRRVFIKDLHSSNKTRVNGKAILPDTLVELRSHDVLSLGNQHFTLGTSRLKVVAPVTREVEVVGKADRPSLFKVLPLMTDWNAWNSNTAIAVGLFVLLMAAMLLGVKSQSESIVKPLSSLSAIKWQMNLAILFATFCTSTFLFWILNFGKRSWWKTGSTGFFAFWLFIISFYVPARSAQIKLNANRVYSHCITKYNQPECLKSVADSKSEWQNVLKIIPEKDRGTIGKYLTEDPGRPNFLPIKKTEGLNSI